MQNKLKDHALGQVGQPERIRADKGYPGKRMVAFQKNAISAGTTPIDGIGARRAVRPQKLRVASGSMIGIGGHLAVPPSHTTGHTGPYHGGSIGLGVGRNVEVGKTETVEIRVAQGLLDRRVS